MSVFRSVLLLLLHLTNKNIDTNKVSELKYILAKKEAEIKRLEMENELMRDFLYLTERK